MAVPERYQALIDHLRKRGLPEELIAMAAASVDDDSEHACQSCRRSSGACMEINNESGETLFESPSQWVYSYRDWRPYALCDQCFRAGRFEVFTQAEIEYFRENFSEEGDGAEEEEFDTPPD